MRELVQVCLSIHALAQIRAKVPVRPKNADSDADADADANTGASAGSPEAGVLYCKAVVIWTKGDAGKSLKVRMLPRPRALVNGAAGGMAGSLFVIDHSRSEY